MKNENKPKPPRVSGAMLDMLNNLAEGHAATAGLRGRSAHGAAFGTLIALRRRGLVSGDEITPTGREYLDGLKK